jgi:tRNA A64-2'-O-ribosylphosphate transferase
MPDALSKTVPIWVAVMNHLLFPDDAACHALHTPEVVVSRSEHAQIEQRLPALVSELRALGLDADVLRAKLRGEPINVAWVTPDSSLLETIEEDVPSNLIVLCTASGRTMSNGPSEFGYVQGAADDSESWACGLTPAFFWKHIDQLLSMAEDELPSTIEGLVLSDKAQMPYRKPVLIKPAINLWIGDNTAAETVYDDFDVILSCSEQPNMLLAQLKDRYIHLPCNTGKVGSRQLRSALSKHLHLVGRFAHDGRILVACQTGKDLAVGVALAFICGRYPNDGTFEPGWQGLDKSVIKQRLSMIMVSMPDAAPSRATLQSVNAFLLGDQAPW